MSEYQKVAFRAIDSPVSDKNLEYMERQSSRAEITPWLFDNEYQFGDFRGNAIEMLRRGYDLYFHYANFGIRKLLIRFADGLPDFAAAELYFGEDALKFLAETDGPGGILSVTPYFEVDDLEELGELDEIVDRLVPLRAEILDGDLRPLYLAHLAIAYDGEHNPEETSEAPVPAGLEKLSDAQRALTEFYGLSESFIAAAAQGGPPLPEPTDHRTHLAQWLQSQPEATKDTWLAQCMTDPSATVRREILASFRQSRGMSPWPTVRKNRTIAELEAATEIIQQESARAKAKNAARQRSKKLADMVADANPTLRKTEVLVEKRSRQAYSQIATLLVDLREALAGGKQSNLAEQQAQKLKMQNPKLALLTSELRRAGFLKK
jgi:hypothetical protein